MAVRDIARDDLVAVVRSVRSAPGAITSGRSSGADVAGAVSGGPRSIDAEREEDVAGHSTEPWIA